MGRESEDKAERVLSIYSKLKSGKVVFKEKESKEYNVSSRTIQRDIADIQCFLQNQNIKTGTLEEIVYDKGCGGYILQTKNRNQLEGKEILAIARVLLDSRALMKSEMFPIVRKLINLCIDESEGKMIAELLRNEMFHYVELKHGKALLKLLWDLERAIKKNQCLEIKYKKLKNQEEVYRKIKPVGIMFSDYYFYLAAFIEDIDRDEMFQNPKDIYPTIYRVDRLQDIEYLDEYFVIPYSERFEEGEFRKRVQFMYGGKLNVVRMKCTEQCLEAVLDRLPTAEIVRKEEDGYVVQAETFGDGIGLWVNGQGAGVRLM